MMRHACLIVAGAVLLAGCSVGVPDFLGREGGGGVTYRLRDDGPPVPESVPLPLRTATAERGLNGVILRVEGLAPTQGHYEATLAPLTGLKPGADGVLDFRLTAIPPATPEAVGPERTRLLQTAVFIPDRALKPVRSLRVKGGANVITVASPRPPETPPILATNIPDEIDASILAPAPAVTVEPEPEPQPTPQAEPREVDPLDPYPVYE